MEWLSGEKAKQYGIKYEYAVRDFATPYQPKWDVWKPREAATP
jgi:hypothetical protein